MQGMNGMAREKGHLSVEIVVIAGVMMMVLFTIFYVNQHLQAAWAVQKQKLEASAAANQIAIAINRAAAGGNTTRIAFNNHVGADVVNITVYGGRSVRAYYSEGGFYSVPLVTNQTNISGAIPLNTEIMVENKNGLVSISAQ